MAKTEVSLEKIIHTDRARRKNEALAAKIFKKDRRASAPGGGSGLISSSATSSLGKQSARAGVKKQRVVSTSAAPRAGNSNTEWTHDLHDNRVGTANKNKKSTSATAVTGALANRISRPGEAPKRQQRQAAKVAAVLAGGAAVARNNKKKNTAAAASSGLSIRGIAAAPEEPLAVMAQNFAPGTTAADIESAMTPVGGLVSSCRILKTNPLVIAEIVFESSDGAKRVIDTFNNQTADGRLLHVYAKVVGFSNRSSNTTSNNNNTTSSNDYTNSGSYNNSGAYDNSGSVESTSYNNGGVLMPHNGNSTETSTGQWAQTTPVAAGGATAVGQKARTGGVYVVDGTQGFDDVMGMDGLQSSSSGQLYSDDLVGAPRAPPTGPAAARTGIPTGPSAGGHGGSHNGNHGNHGGNHGNHGGNRGGNYGGNYGGARRGNWIGRANGGGAGWGGRGGRNGQQGGHGGQGGWLARQ